MLGSTSTSVNNRTNVGIATQVSRGGHEVGNRAALHEHRFGAISTVIKGYVTLFLDGCAPLTAGPGDSYYMPGNNKVICVDVMPKTCI